jgi:hypothetical protein
LLVFFPKKRERAVSEEQKHRNFQEHTQEREREREREKKEILNTAAIFENLFQ